MYNKKACQGLCHWCDHKTEKCKHKICKAVKYNTKKLNRKVREEDYV